MQTIAILGSTGSIGTQALELVRLHPEEFRVVALTAGRSCSSRCGSSGRKSRV